eukprot:6983360-Pyramimonas_sp.AAC.1
MRLLHQFRHILARFVPHEEFLPNPDGTARARPPRPSRYTLRALRGPARSSNEGPSGAVHT